MEPRRSLLGLPLWVGFWAVAVVAAVIALVVSIPVMRTRAVYFFMASWAVGEVIKRVSAYYRAFFGGWEGLFKILPPKLGPVDFANRTAYYYLALVLMVLMGYSVKLLAIAKRSGDSLELRVHPTLIPRSHLLANVGGVYNAIFVKGDLIGENLFYGQGAGAAPTSSGVVSDIVAVAKSMTSGCCKVERCIAIKKDVRCLEKIGDVKTRHYIKFLAVDKPGVLAKISGVLAKYKISIASVTQKEKRALSVVSIVMMTHDVLEKDMAMALKEIAALDVVKRKLVRIRVES